MSTAGIASASLPHMIREAEKHASKVRRRKHKAIRELVSKVVVSTKGITIEVETNAICKALGCEPPDTSEPIIKLASELQLRRSGRAMKLVRRDGRTVTAGTPDPALIELLQKARGWWLQLQDGRTDIASIARTEKVNDSWISRLVKLNFLAPKLVEAILAGTQPASVNATSLRRSDLPLAWDEQIELFRL